MVKFSELGPGKDIFSVYWWGYVGGAIIVVGLLILIIMQLTDNISDGWAWFWISVAIVVSGLHAVTTFGRAYFTATTAVAKGVTNTGMDALQQVGTAMFNQLM